MFWRETNTGENILHAIIFLSHQQRYLWYSEETILFIFKNACSYIEILFQGINIDFFLSCQLKNVKFSKLFILLKFTFCLQALQQLIILHLLIYRSINSCQARCIYKLNFIVYSLLAPLEWITGVYNRLWTSQI